MTRPTHVGYLWVRHGTLSEWTAPVDYEVVVCCGSEQHCRQLADRVERLDAPLDLSATAVRDRVAQCLARHGLVTLPADSVHRQGWARDIPVT